MTHTEFGAVIAWLETAVGRSICDGAAEQKLARTIVYFDMLGDLPAAVLRAAVKCVALSHKWANFPSVAEIRQAAVDILAGPSAAPSFAEAWRLAIEAAKRMSTVTDPTYQIIRNGVVMSPAEWNEKILAGLPPVVALTLRSFGWGALHEDDTVRAQFRRMYDDFVESEQRQRLLPPSLAKEIQALSRDRPATTPIAPTVKAIAGRIGALPA